MTIRLSILFVLFFVAIAGFSQEWSSVMQKDNVQVYSRKADSKSIKEVKIVGKLQATIHEVVAALEDFDFHEKWVYKTIDSRIIELVDDGKLYYYISSRFPFPAQDRDLVIYYERTQNPDTKIVFTKSIAAPSKEPTYDKFIRIEDFVATYEIKPMPDGWVEIEYLLKSDPGGSLPKWIINLAIVEGPMKTMQRLFTLIESGKYKNQKVTGIIE